MAWRRRAVRAVVLTPDARVLLQHGDDPVDRSTPAYWFLPGGGIDGHEAPEHALRRELWEECGIEEVDVIGHLWDQRAVFRFAGIDFDQEEEVLLARVPAAAEIRPQALEALEVLAFKEPRWWPLAELGTTTETIYPIDLVERLRTAGLMPDDT